ncbi:hypothetical protein SEA_SPIKELEE_100 [Mycobacterium phage Spikelee]|uniref:Uncharacterized protein n=1 Tax=Mycobacterium phage Spikelee TaxID=2301571 RepID=A0A385DUI9_9CAUD|nr:hypothetical protein I5H90_gp100 [Mycobacterium phage Spikelee]AXQ62229.1 hypothetical protein SEA_SPIKELEE_100 [Mycobacterium phage Spikelee]
MIHIEVDGKVLMHSDPGEWITTPPDIPAVQKAGPNEPWMLLVQAALAKAATLAMAGKIPEETTICVTTRKNGWIVDYTNG